MVVFVIPVYNEQDNIQMLLAKTSEKMRQLNMPFRIIIIDDGSSDNTVEMANRLSDKIPLAVYSHYPNKGVGEAFRVGFRKAAEICTGDDIIVTKEADNTSDLNILNNLISKIESGYDVALASCYAGEGGVLGTSVFRLFLSRTANTIIKLFLPLKNINTYSSFYRVYRSSALKDILSVYGNNLMEADGFECMVELLIKFSRNGFKITEIPMILDGSRRIGKSKMRILKTIKGFLAVILRECMIYRIQTSFKEMRMKFKRGSVL